MLGWVLSLSGVLLVTVGLGVLVHESLHALVLRTAGVDCTVQFRGESGGNGFRTLATGALASVNIEGIPRQCPTWRLRLAAMAPLAMLVPVAIYAILLTQGHVVGSRLGSVVVIAWMAAALPSPADFAIVWNPQETRDLSDGS